MPIRTKYRCWIVTLGFLATWVAPVLAAQRLVLSYGIFSQSVSIPELRTLADTGVATRNIQFYLNLLGLESGELRRILNEEVAIDGITLDRVLKSPVGNLILDEISQVIHTPIDQGNRESLQAALVSSALPDGKLSLLEVLENYPTEAVHLNGDRAIELYQKINSLLQQLPRISLLNL